MLRVYGFGSLRVLFRVLWGFLKWVQLGFSKVRRVWEFGIQSFLARMNFGDLIATKYYLWIRRPTVLRLLPLN